MAAAPSLLVQGEAPPPLEREFTVIGKDVNRLEGAEKATGTAQYSGDISSKACCMQRYYAPLMRTRE